jgi:hypothetical protein
VWSFYSEHSNEPHVDKCHMSFMSDSALVWMLARHIVNHCDCQAFAVFDGDPIGYGWYIGTHDSCSSR